MRCKAWKPVKVGQVWSLQARVCAKSVLRAQRLSRLVCAGQHITVATIQDGQLQRTTMTAVPAPPPSAFIDSAGAGDELPASTAVALPLHASKA